jgi:hypothetical protein
VVGIPAAAVIPVAGEAMSAAAVIREAAEEGISVAVRHISALAPRLRISVPRARISLLLMSRILPDHQFTRMQPLVLASTAPMSATRMSRRPLHIR